MKGFNLAIAALVAFDASEYGSAFCPSNLLRPQHVMRATSVDMATAKSDTSVPYDAAARLAYDDWCKTYGKEFDSNRFEVFKENYVAITVMNVSSKKAARESGENNPSLLALNEYADFTAEEYEAAMNGEKVSTTSDVLGKVAEAAESQLAASSALQDAADALAEEEEKLAAQLGLDSVEELEAAIDEMDGIAPDGSQLEGENLAREARIRSAYLNWCKEYKKEQDETRFKQFSTNFLEMEQYAKESGKEMALNEYADCTEEEYSALMAGEEAVKEAESAIQAADDEMNAKSFADTKAEAEAASAKKAADEKAAAKAKEEERKKAAIAAKKAEEDAKKKAEIEAKKKAEEERKKALAEKARLASMSAEERRQEIEKEKSARQAAQDKELEKERMDAAAAAIRAAKEAEEAAAAQIAKQRAIAEEAAEKLRAQARDWEEKQAKLAPKPKTAPEPQAKPKRSMMPSLDLGSLFGSSDEQPSKPATPKPKAKISPKDATPRPTLSLGSFFESATPKKGSTKAAPKQAAAKAVPNKSTAKAKSPTPAPRPTLSLADFLPSPAAAPKVASKPAGKAQPRPSLGLNVFNAPAPSAKKAPEAKAKPAPKIDTSDPVTEAFSSIFGGKKATTPDPKPKADPPVPTPTEASSPAFSFFSASKAVPKSKPSPPQAPAQAPKQSAPSFSFFSPNPAPKAEPAPAPAPAPAPKPAPAFSLFSPKPAPKVEPIPAPAPKSAPSPAFSFFSPKPALKSEPAPAPAPAPAPKPSFSLFGSSKPSTPKGSAKVAPAKREAPARPTLSLFNSPKGGTQSVTPATKKTPVKKGAIQKTPPQDNIPVLSRWTQNEDGSITGFVSNSPSFRNGTKITTSPVRKGAKANSVVRTGSGSQYRLS